MAEPMRKTSPDAHRVLVPAGGRHVLAEAAGHEQRGLGGKGGGQPRVVFRGVVVQRLVRAAVHAAVGLCVALQSFRTEQDGAGYCFLENPAGMALRRQRADAAGEDGVDHRERLANAPAWATSMASSASIEMPRSRS
jgi:hypothetical protein